MNSIIKFILNIILALAISSLLLCIVMGLDKIITSEAVKKFFAPGPYQSPAQEEAERMLWLFGLDDKPSRDALARLLGFRNLSSTDRLLPPVDECGNEFPSDDADPRYTIRE